MFLPVNGRVWRWSKEGRQPMRYSVIGPLLATPPAGTFVRGPARLANNCVVAAMRMLENGKGSASGRINEQLFALIAQDVALTETDKALCAAAFHAQRCAKQQILEPAGKVPEHLYFVLSGYLRLFHYNDKGDEVTTHINCPPGFITSYFNFINGTASNEVLQCVTDCSLLRITKPDLDQLTAASTAFKDFSIRVFQRSIAYNDRRNKELSTLTAEERYRALLSTYPDMLLHVPLQHIASYLGMNPKSLSRIRRTIIR